MKQLFALIMIAFLVPTAAMAKDSPCKEDKTKFCKEVKAAGGKVKACLREHMEELSPACKESLVKKKREAKPADAKKPSDAAKPADATPADQATPPSDPASPGAAESKP
ncbi:MAG: cysteine rich repeat-containing protein [Methyloceanibacter sp.]